NRLRPCLELVRELAPGCPVELDRADHVTAEIERSHPLEDLRPTPERADARGATELVGREREEVAVERLDVDRLVRGGLRGVDDHDRTALVCPRAELLDRIDRPERVRDEVVRNDLDLPLAGGLVEQVEPQLTRSEE